MLRDDSHFRLKLKTRSMVPIEQGSRQSTFGDVSAPISSHGGALSEIGCNQIGSYKGVGSGLNKNCVETQESCGHECFQSQSRETEWEKVECNEAVQIPGEVFAQGCTGCCNTGAPWSTLDPRSGLFTVNPQLEQLNGGLSSRS